MFVSFFLSLIALLGFPWPCLSCLALLNLELLVVLSFALRCLFVAWCYLALLGFVDVACLAWHCLAMLGTVWHCFALFGVACLTWPCRLSVLVALVRFCSLTRFPFSACLVGGWVTESACRFIYTAGRWCLSKRGRGPGKGYYPPWWVSGSAFIFEWVRPV